MTVNADFPISYVVPAFNCAAYIEEALNSIYDGNFQPGDEVIVVDDASTDDTPQIVQRIAQQRENLLVSTHRFNRGSAAAGRNTAIDRSRNKLIFCLDADNVLVPDSVHALKREMLRRGAGAASFSEIHFFRGDQRSVVSRWTFPQEIHLQDVFATSIWPGPTGNYLFTRESWVAAGRYNDDRYVGVLDSWVFGVRQLAAGIRMITLADSHYLHRVGIESHYVLNSKRLNVSLTALSLLIPFFPLLEEDDIEYLLSKENRDSWFGRLDMRPLRLRDSPAGTAGKVLRSGPMRRAWAKFRGYAR